MKHLLFSKWLLVKKTYSINSRDIFCFPDDSVIVLDDSDPPPCVTLSSESDTSDDSEEEEEEDDGDDQNSIIKQIVGACLCSFGKIAY